MARYDLYAHPGGEGFVLDVQADVLAGLNTRLVVPLLPASQAPLPAKRLNPVFQLGAVPHVMVTQFLSAVPLSVLGPVLGNLALHDVEVMAALDMVLIGF